MKVVQQEVSGPWKWSISHTRFRGRGRGAAEKQIGSDVIIELVVRRPNHYQVDSKSLLIQAKKNWTNDPKIIVQVARLSTWREAVAVLNSTSKHFEAFRIDDVLATKGQRPSNVAVRLSEPSQILDVPYSPNTSELRAARRRLQKIYHTDKHTGAPDFVEQTMKRRSQEVNHAFDELDRDR